MERVDPGRRLTARRKRDDCTGVTQKRRRRLGIVGLVVDGELGSVHPANADEAHARELVKAMSDYLGRPSRSSRSASTAVLAVVTSDLQKVDFASSGTVSLSRPDKIRVTRTGGFADVEMVFDGKQLSILGKNLDRYAQVEAPGTVEQLYRPSPRQPRGRGARRRPASPQRERQADGGGRRA